LKQETIVSLPLHDALRPFVEGDDLLSVRGLTILSWIVANSDEPEKRTVRAIHGEFGIPKPSVTRVMDALFPVYAKRVPDPSDRRSVLCQATPVGRQLMGAPPGSDKRERTRPKSRSGQGAPA
jgi:DNA-binding MarR family transcriptional regulator